MSIYLPGVTKAPTKTADPEGDRARQRQRAIERKIRQYKERELAALTPEAKAAAKVKVKQWQSIMRDHLKANPKLKRQSHREAIGAGSIPRVPSDSQVAPVADITPGPVQQVLDLDVDRARARREQLAAERAERRRLEEQARTQAAALEAERQKAEQAAERQRVLAEAEKARLESEEAARVLAEREAAERAAEEERLRVEAEAAEAERVRLEAERQQADREAEEAERERQRLLKEQAAEQARRDAEAQAELERLEAERQEAERRAEEERARAEEEARRAEQDRLTAEAAARAAATVPNGDFSSLRQIGPQGGSNPGGLYEAPDGTRWYVKTQKSELHAANEIAAARLYTAAGILAPEIHAGRGAPGLPDGPQAASRVIEGREASPDELRAPAREGFGLDAWLANWDVAGLTFDNMLLADDGSVVRIDTGGSLLFRAQGEPKGDKFGNTVNEWLTLRDREQAEQAAQLFGGLTPAEQETALKRVEQVPPGEIRRIVRESGLPDSVADTLIARRTDLLKRLTSVKAAAKRQRAYDKAIKTAATGDDALNVIPRRLALRHPYKLEPAPPWADDHIRESEKALDWYRNSGYQNINAWLRADDPDHPQVDAIDRAMDSSQTTRDALVYRGIQNPYVVFGAGWNDVDVSGLEWVEKAYGSSSADVRVAENFAESPGLIMRILAPKGSKAIRLSDMVGPDRVPFSIEEEAELLNGRGIHYRVVADRGYDAEGRRHIDVEVIAP
ncbi:phage minor capsid protein [Acrocarpospora sp. B8E8]|uniref:phage minor capsid protein n=1 Tax=Acrocarpospora sp. B8E8 TaxID=3153572 RepID=UPI00325DF6FC